MRDIKKVVGNRIKVLRNEREWSQEELAHRAEIHPSHLGRMERGEKSTTIGSLEKVISALGITFEELFRFVNPEYIDKDTDILFNIINKLSKRSVEDQKIILNLIDTLFQWKDDK